MANIKTICLAGEWLRVVIDDGRTLHVQKQHFKRLRSATEEQLMKYELLDGGVGVHWPDLDEDISIRGFLRYAEESQ